MTNESAAGAAVYSRPTLAIYDLFVLGFSNRYVWDCPSSILLEHYNQHISAKHMDVGVGTGYFLDRCRFPTEKPNIVLADLNPNSLEVTAKRLARFEPLTVVANVLKPLNLDDSFDSIGLNYLLHCLPGSMHTKGVVFKHLKTHLNANGVLFGSTILGQDVKHNFIGQRLMNIYNKRGIFCNIEDSLTALEKSLTETFSDFNVTQKGRVALFWARA